MAASSVHLPLDNYSFSKENLSGQEANLFYSLFQFYANNEPEAMEGSESHQEGGSISDVQGGYVMPVKSLKEIGIKIDFDKFLTNPPQELFGHVTLVEGYALTSFTGCHALVSLRDTPGKTVAVLTTEIRLQSLLETALATGNLIAFWGVKQTNPPTPMGGTWAVEVYSISNVILYSMK